MPLGPFARRWRACALALCVATAAWLAAAPAGPVAAWTAAGAALLPVGGRGLVRRYRVRRWVGARVGP
ncbi:hypothetical protein NKH77_30520 [Streptomyces sp. M19]